MATGYTHPIIDGEITTLRQFTLACARAYLFEFKESDIPIPKSAELMPEVIPGPDTAYHDESLKELEDKLKMLKEMSPFEAEHYYIKEEDRADSFYEGIETKDKENNALIQSMLDKVKAWDPPTEAHRVGIKKFMIEQLEMSLSDPDSRRYFTPDPETRSVAERHVEEIESIQSGISRTKTRLAGIVTNWEKTQLWWSQLRESVPEEPIDKPATN